MGQCIEDQSWPCSSLISISVESSLHGRSLTGDVHTLEHGVVLMIWALLSGCRGGRYLFSFTFTPHFQFPLRVCKSLGNFTDRTMDHRHLRLLCFWGTTERGEAMAVFLILASAGRILPFVGRVHRPYAERRPQGIIH